MSRHSGAAGPSQRQLRVGEQLRHILSDVLRRGDFRDPILFEAAGTITVSEVRPSPDMKQATAYVMSLGGENMDEILPALNEAAGVFQKEIGRQMNMKFTPRVRFIRDSSFDEANKIESILQNLHTGKSE